ncbi:MAG: YggS family pyridoxal phosphate-dependent enzyme [Chloroflexi bacterium]|nr:YggS family pyridoxal phosphate-dependent enzyme [Chloroflexota bacterium]
MKQSVEEEVELVEQSVRHILDNVPTDVIVVAAAKGRTLTEVEAVIEAGITHIGHNYIQEAQLMVPALAGKATWHMIGHLQRNKAKKAVHLFDMLETVDSLHLAQTIDRRCAAIGKVIPILIEINSGEEPSKTGVLPKDVDELVATISDLKHISIQGLMTMGPRFGDPENARSFFQETKRAFERLSKSNIPNIEMRYLSMGMSNSYLVAIEEGANIVRIGTKIFGSRRD